jgi:hypothetical protein
MMWFIRACKRVGWYALAPYRFAPVCLVLFPIIYLCAKDDSRLQAECASKGGTMVANKCLANVHVIELE